MNNHPAPTDARLWCAYWRAPIVAPLAFVAYFMLIIFYSHQLGLKTNPLAVVGLPLMAFLFGIPLAYVLALIGWMPTMRWLARRGWYTRGNVLWAGGAMAIGFAFLARLLVRASEPWPLTDSIRFIGLAFVGTAPAILLAAFVFYRVSSQPPRPAKDNPNRLF